MAGTTRRLILISLSLVLSAALWGCGMEWLSEQAPYRPDFTVLPAPPATPLSPHSAFTSVSVGSYDICGVRADGSLFCRETRFGVEVAPPQGPFRSVSVGDRRYICGVRDDGSVACWGSDEVGLTPPDGSFTSVSVGDKHSCGVREDGSIACWGSDEFEQATPPEDSFTSVSVGGRHSCGIRHDGSIACWGSDEYGQATLPEGSFTSVSVGGSRHICGVREDGSIACGGCAVLGEGVYTCPGTADEQAAPPEGSFTSVSVGEDIACGLRENKTLACWSLVVDLPSPDDLPPDTFTQGTFISVSVGSVEPHYSDDGAVVDYWPAVVCAVREEGAIACWGDVPGHLPTPALSITGRASSSLTVEWADPEWEDDPEWGYDMEPPRYYHYQLHASQTPEGPYNLSMSGVDAGTYVVEGLQPGAVHYLALLICDEFECSQTMAVATTESDGSVRIPPTPSGFQGKKIVNRGTFAVDDAKLNWEPVAGATYYELWKGSDPDRPFELVVQINAPLEAQSFEIAPNRFFGGYDLTSWKVRACNKAGCSPFTSNVTIE